MPTTSAPWGHEHYRNITKPVEYFMAWPHKDHRGMPSISEQEGSKKFVQQDRSHFDARSVLSVREHGKMARTPLAAFFNLP
jgi:hypothetical protein